MTYDPEEQDKLDTLKTFWQQYRILIIGLFLATLIGFSLWNGWQYWQKKQTTEAAILYDQLEQAVLNKDTPKILRATNDLQNKFPRTTYAQLATLNAAKATFDTHDLKITKTLLQWIIEHGKSDELKHLARLRLATTLVEEKDYAKAFQLLSAPHPTGFIALYAQYRGDILFAQGKMTEAYSAYKLALDNTDLQANEQRQILNLKLDLIGN